MGRGKAGHELSVGDLLPRLEQVPAGPRHTKVSLPPSTPSPSPAIRTPGADSHNWDERAGRRVLKLLQEQLADHGGGICQKWTQVIHDPG